MKPHADSYRQLIKLINLQLGRSGKMIQITNIGNEKCDITRDSTDIKSIAKGYYKQLYTNKFDK